MGVSEITIYQGDALTINVTVKDNSGNVLSLTPFNEIYFSIRQNLEDEVNILEKKLSLAEIVVVSAPKGQLRIVLKNDDTAGLLGKYYYEVTLEDTSEDLQYVVVQDFFKVLECLVVPVGG